MNAGLYVRKPMFSFFSKKLPNCQTVFQSSCTIFNFYQQWMRVPFALCPQQHLVCYCCGCWLFNRYVVVSLCCFNLHFPYDTWCGVFFHMLIWHLYIFFGEVSVKIFDLFFNWIVCFLIVLRVSCIFWLTVHYQIENILFCGLSSHSLESFADQKFFFIFTSF